MRFSNDFSVVGNVIIGNYCHTGLHASSGIWALLKFGSDISFRSLYFLHIGRTGIEPGGGGGLPPSGTTVVLGGVKSKKDYELTRISAQIPFDF